MLKNGLHLILVNNVLKGRDVMSNFLPQAVAEMYKENDTKIQGNVFQLIGDLIEEIRETTEARKKIIREIMEDTMNFRINIFEKLALHFSREAMLEERKRKTLLTLFDQITFTKPPNIRW
jgi:hypothetical protein